MYVVGNVVRVRYGGGKWSGRAKNENCDMNEQPERKNE